MILKLYRIHIWRYNMRKFLFKGMMIIVVAIVIITVILLTIYTLFFDPPTNANGFKEYKSVRYVDHNTIEYNGQKYRENKSDLTDIIKNNIDNLSLISWNYSLHLSTVSYYSYDCDNPDYILYDAGSYKTVYFKESLDFKDMVFVFENTELQVSYKDTYTYKGNFNDREEYKHYTNCYLYIKNNPELKIQLSIYTKNDKEYMYTINCDNQSQMHIVSQSFLDMLLENGF